MFGGDRRRILEWAVSQEPGCCAIATANGELAGYVFGRRGRVFNHDLGNGDWSERGGTFVGPTQDHILELAKAYGIKTFDTYDPWIPIRVLGSTSG